MRAFLLICGAGTLLWLPAGAGAWGPPAPLAAERGVEQRAPALARNAHGDAVAVWVRAPIAAGPGAGRVMLAQRRGPRGAWARARPVSGTGVGAPAVALGPRGAAIVAWGAGGRVHVAMRDARAAPWRLAAPAVGPGRVTDLAVGVDAAGAMAVMWSEAIGARYRVRRALRPGPGASWRVGASSVVTAGRPALATGVAGNGVVAWTADGRIGAVRATPQGFSAPVSLGEGDSFMPALDSGAGGSFVAAWRSRLPGGTAVVAAAQQTRAGDLQRLGDVGVGDGPRAGLNARGDAFVVWALSDERGDRAGIQAVTARAGRGWVPVTVVRQRACACRYEIGDAAVDGRGGLLVAWRRSSRRATDVAAVSARAGGGGRWRGHALRPVPDVASVDLAVDGGPGAGVLWSLAGHVRGMLRPGPVTR